MLTVSILSTASIWTPVVSATNAATSSNPPDANAAELPPFLQTKPSRHEFQFPTSSVADTAETATATANKARRTSSTASTANKKKPQPARPKQLRGRQVRRRNNRILSQHYTSTQGGATPPGIEMGHASVTMEMHHQAEMAHTYHPSTGEDDDYYHDGNSTEHHHPHHKQKHHHHHHQHGHNHHEKQKNAYDPKYKLPYGPYSKSKSKTSKSDTKYKGAVKAVHGEGYPPEDDDAEAYADGYYYYAKSKSKGSKSKSRQVHRGKKSKKGRGELRYFEASLLLGMQDHYVAELSSLDLRQLETSVVDTYNYLSTTNCDLQGRELIAATMDPTPTSTGYILHMQGQCYGCDPSSVRVFAHPEDIFDDGEMMMRPTDNGAGMMMGGDPGMPPPPSDMAEPPGTDAGTPPPGTDGMDGTTTDMMTAGNTTGGLTPDMMADGGMATANANATQPPTDSEPPPPMDTNATTAYGRNSGALPRLQKKRKTFSKQRSRLKRSEDQEEEALEDAIPDFNFGLDAQSRAAYYHQNQQNGGRRLNHQHHHQHHSAAFIDEHADHVPEGAALNRGPELDEMLYAEQDEAEDRAGHYAHYADPDVGLIMPYKVSKTVHYGKSKSTKSKMAGYHPTERCSNPEATQRAPSEEEFVLALNQVTNDLLAQYNKLSIRSAVQVQTEPCSATEEEFDSSLVVQFRGPQGITVESLTPEEAAFAEQTFLQTYNHLQATQSCDVPFFREMTAIVLRGVAPGPVPDTFLVMLEVKGTCRGDACDEGATFFDPRDDDERARKLSSHAQMPTAGFNSYLTRSGHEVTYDEGSAHVYQEQCYCPFMIEEFGPPFVSDMVEVLDRTVQQAYDAGRIKSVVSVVDIVEVKDDDEVAYDEMPPSVGQNPLESFVVVQFFGQRDLVTEQEVREIQLSMPLIYNNLQENSFCDPFTRVLETAVLETVDPGPTADSFLLGFSLTGSCVGTGCSGGRMFFAPSGQQFVSCGGNRVEGGPVIEDFENDLFQAILALRGTGDLVYIQASGDAVEVLPGGTPAPIFTGPAVPAPAPTPAVANNFAGRSSTQNRYGYAPGPAPGKPPGPSPGRPQPTRTEEPTAYPTWLDTAWPTWYED